jgi:predicted ATPase
MKIGGIRLVGIRCFEDTGDMQLAGRFNLIVGQNNAGKSTFLKGVMHLQGSPLDQQDVRPQCPTSWLTVWLTDVKQQDAFAGWSYQAPDMRVILQLNAGNENYNDFPVLQTGAGNQLFHANRPHHHIVPFLAKRKASGFSEAINQGAHAPVNGTLQNLYANIDVLATAGHPKHQDYLDSVTEVLGLTITTRASGNGKVAGFYLDQDNFITLDRMGDGVTEIVALITELCLSRNKIFVLEEPETNLHPKGLKALLELVRRSAEHNQFIIARTWSRRAQQGIPGLPGR